MDNPIPVEKVRYSDASDGQTDGRGGGQPENFKFTYLHPCLVKSDIGCHHTGCSMYSCERLWVQFCN